MKRKTIKGDLLVTCSFCKRKNAKHIIVGGFLSDYNGFIGGRTVCEECYNIVKIKNDKHQPCSENTLAEEQLYSMYKI
jgi:hypothetical protein